MVTVPVVDKNLSEIVTNVKKVEDDVGRGAR